MSAVESFDGSLKWITTFRDRESLPGRNWSVMPERFKEFLKELKNNPDITNAKRAFAITEPEVGKAANRELPDLAEHIKDFVQKGLASKVLA